MAAKYYKKKTKTTKKIMWYPNKSMWYPFTGAISDKITKNLKNLLTILLMSQRNDKYYSTQWEIWCHHECKPLSNRENIRVKKWQILLFLLYLLDKEPATDKISKLYITFKCIAMH